VSTSAVHTSVIHTSVHTTVPADAASSALPASFPRPPLPPLPLLTTDMATTVAETAAVPQYAIPTRAAYAHPNSIVQLVDDDMLPSPQHPLPQNDSRHGPQRTPPALAPPPPPPPPPPPSPSSPLECLRGFMLAGGRWSDEILSIALEILILAAREHSTLRLQPPLLAAVCLFLAVRNVRPRSNQNSFQISKHHYFWSA